MDSLQRFALLRDYAKLVPACFVPQSVGVRRLSSDLKQGAGGDASRRQRMSNVAKPSLKCSGAVCGAAGRNHPEHSVRGWCGRCSAIIWLASSWRLLPAGSLE